MIYAWALAPVTSAFDPGSEIAPDCCKCFSRVFDSCLIENWHRPALARVPLWERGGLIAPRLRATDEALSLVASPRIPGPIPDAFVNNASYP